MILLHEGGNLLDFTNLLMIGGGILVFVLLFILIKKWERKGNRKNKK